MFLRCSGRPFSKAACSFALAQFGFTFVATVTCYRFRVQGLKKNSGPTSFDLSQMFNRSSSVAKVPHRVHSLLTIDKMLSAAQILLLFLSMCR